jgi:photosystem II stability/assembly factor-like uncharacterized protein
MKVNNHIFSLGVLFLFANIASAQWVQTNGPYGGAISSIAVKGHTIFIGDNIGGIYRSADNGANWVFSGLADSNVASLAVLGNYLFAGTGEGIFISSDNGVSWDMADSGLKNLFIKTLAVNGSIIYAGTWGSGVFRSSDTGKSWIEVNTHLTSDGCFWITSLFASGTVLFAGAGFGGGSYVSIDSGAYWQCILDNPTANIDWNECSFTMKENFLFAGTTAGVYRTANFSGYYPFSWSRMGLSDKVIYALATIGSAIFAGTNKGLYTSTDNGTTWNVVNLGIPDSCVLSLAESENNIFAGTKSGIFLSTNGGANWTEINTGLLHNSINSIVANGKTIFAGSRAGLFSLTNNGTSNWDHSGLNDRFVSSIVKRNGAFFAATDSGVFLSINNGSSWNAVDSGLPKVYNKYFISLAVNDSFVFYGTAYSAIFRSANNGASWTPFLFSQTHFLYVLAATENSIYFGGEGLFRSTNNGANWTAAISGLTDTNIISLAINGNTIFAGTGGSGVFRSDNNGSSWTAANSNITNRRIWSLAAFGNNIFAATDNGIFLSTNNGASSWTEIDSGLPSKIISSIAVGDADLFAGIKDYGVWHRPLSEVVQVINPQAGLQKLSVFKVSALSRSDLNIGIVFILPFSGKVTVKIYNMYGREITTLVNKNLQAGPHRFLWDTRNSAPGYYTVRMRTGANTYAKSIPILK